MSFDNTKYDVEINGVPHRIRGYVKSEAPAFVPRVGGGEQSATEFNVLLSKALKDFSGGSLQRFWEDDTSIFASESLYPIYEDGVLYPVEASSSDTDIMGKSVALAFAQNQTYLFIALKGFTGTNAVTRVAKDGTVTSITLPANISSSSGSIRDIVIWDNNVWITWFNDSTTYRMAYFSVTGTSATEVSAGTNGSFSKMCVYRGQLYGLGQDSTYRYLYRYTGTTSSRAFVLVGNLGRSEIDYNEDILVYNNRILIMRNEGMYAFDGVTLNQIEDMTKAVSNDNYRFPSVLRGFLYYFMPDGFYRFNGSLIEKLYDISEIGYPRHMAPGKNRLWIVFANAESASSRYDKSMGYDYSTGNDIDGRVMVFNGKGMYTYGRTSTFVKNPGTDDIANQGIVDKVVWFNDKLYVFTYFDKQGPGTYYYWDTDELALAGNKAWRLHTSIFDADFPMVDKNIENMELVLDGDVPSSQSITIEYRTSGFSDDGGWTTLGTFNTTTELKRYIWKSLTSGLSGKRFQFRLTGTTAAGVGLAKLIIRYTLQPDFKWQWQFDVLAYGDDPLAPLILADGSHSDQTVRALRGNIYAARSSDVPVKFVDIDQLDLSGAHDDSTTTITVNSTSLLKGEDGFIQVDDEIMYWYAKTATQLTVVRGVLGTAAAAHDNNDKVFIVYRVIVKQIGRELITMPDNGRQTLEDKDWASQINVVLTEV